MNTEWKGIFPAVTTKFKEDDSLDFDAMRHNFEAQIEAGVHGIIVSGSLGESSTLTPREKLDVLQLALDVSSGRIPVLIGVAERRTIDACDFVRKAGDLGADGFMVLPPMQYKTDERETMHHFRTVAKASAKPIMVYNNPVAYAVDVTPEMFIELADEPKFVAIKESSDNVRRISDIYNAVGNRYQVFTGVDNLALESLLIGAVGWVAGLVCAFPRETVVIYELAQAGKLEEARALYRWFRPLLDLDVNTKLVQNIKLAEVATGLGTERVRPPRLPLIGEEREHVMKVIEDALAVRPKLPEPLAV